MRFPWAISRAGYLKDQLERALSSAILNLAEGNGRKSTKERNRFFDISSASIDEITSIMDLFMVFGYISKTECILSKNLLNRAVWYIKKLKQFNLNISVS